MPRLNSLNTFVSSSILNPVGGGVDPEESNYASATMVFIQGTAPTGWVKVTADNDYTLRCVTGSALSGGSSDFSTVMAPKSVIGTVPISGSVGTTALTVSQMGVHSHPAPASFTGTVQTTLLNSGTPGAGRSTSTGFYTGSIAPSPTSPGVSAGQSHTHPGAPTGRTGPVTLSTVNLSVKYVEAILATRI